MRFLITFCLALFLFSTATPSVAAPNKNKGPSDQAYDSANDNASFKRNEQKGSKYQTL